jgi:hypothetical protein
MPRVQMDDQFPQSHLNASHSSAGAGTSNNSSGSQHDFFLSSGDLHQPSTVNQPQQGQVRPLFFSNGCVMHLFSFLFLSFHPIHISRDRRNWSCPPLSPLTLSLRQEVDTRATGLLCTFCTSLQRQWGQEIIDMNTSLQNHVAKRWI